MEFIFIMDRNLQFNKPTELSYIMSQSLFYTSKKFIVLNFIKGSYFKNKQSAQPLKIRGFGGVTPECSTNMAWGDEDGKTLYLTAHGSLYKIKVNTDGNLVGSNLLSLIKLSKNSWKFNHQFSII